MLHELEAKTIMNEVDHGYHMNSSGQEITPELLLLLLMLFLVSHFQANNPPPPQFLVYSL